MEKTKFICDKCGNDVFEIALHQPAGVLFDEIYGKVMKKTISITCVKCGDSGIYKTATDTVANIILSSQKNQPKQ